MSTRSLISIQRKDDEYECIYCHSDGYLTYNGAMLLDHYSDKEKLEKLIKLGNISSLDINVDPDPSKPHSFDYDKRQDGVVIAYARDRGDKNEHSRICNMKEMLDWGWIEYIYIFDKDGKWKYLQPPNETIKYVEDGLAKEYKRMGIRRPKDFYGFFTETSLREERKRQQQEDEEME